MHFALLAIKIVLGRSNLLNTKSNFIINTLTNQQSSKHDRRIEKKTIYRQNVLMKL